MITEILTRPAEIQIENNSYKIEYDNKAYAQLEMMTGKGVFQIYEGLLKGTLKLSEYNDIVCCALEKHNDSKQIKEIKKYIDKNPSFITKNMVNISSAFVTPLVPPEQVQQNQEKKALKKK